MSRPAIGMLTSRSREIPGTSPAGTNSVVPTAKAPRDSAARASDAFTARNVRYEAGNAVAYGMEYNAALRAVTLTPAETFGVADQVGSLAAGKRADVVIWSGDPFEFSSQAEHVFVNGVQSNARTREDLLEARYKNLPPSPRSP